SAYYFFQAEDGIRDWSVTGVQTCALPISDRREEPPGVQGRQAWPGCEHFGDGREHEVDGEAGHDDQRGALGYRLPGQRMRLLLEIGRASCRERGEISGGRGRLRKKEQE